MTNQFCHSSSPTLKSIIYSLYFANPQMITANDAGNQTAHPRTQEQTDSATGWQATENYLFKHDSDIVKDYADDVDALLVFAGLFSAVLTAFVVEYSKKLEADNEENTVKVLSRIAAQLESYTINNGYVNSSTPVNPLPDFTPSVAVLCINILWFLSLIASLAAAFFGILVKQWLREYLKWNSPLAHPRENILVRQVRFEAWKDWYFPATISMIPALLEGSLVLFVCGLAALLWGLDRRVAIVATVAIGLFLLVVAAVTILPMFFKRCPYKSPIAWAWAYSFDFIVDLVGYIMVVYVSWTKPAANEAVRTFRRWRRKHWRTANSSWRKRDLTSVDISWGKRAGQDNQHVLLSLCGELTREAAEIDSKGNHILEPNVTVVNEKQLTTARDVLRSASQLPILCDALSWVMRASQGTRIQQHVLHCADTMLPPASKQPSSIVHNLSTWYLLCRLFQSGRLVSSAVDVQNWTEDNKITEFRRHLRSLWTIVDTKHLPRTNGYAYDLADKLFDLRHPTDVQLGFENDNLYQIILHVLAGNVRASVGEVVKVKENRWWDSADHVHLRRITEMLAALALLLPWSKGGYHLLPGSRSQPSCLPVLLDAHNLICRSICKKDIEWWFPGLRHMMLRVVNHFATVDVAEDGGLFISPVERLPLKRHCRLEKKLYPFAMQGTYEDRQLYVFALSEVFHDLAQHTRKGTFDKINPRLQELFAFDGPSTLKNGGTYSFVIPSALSAFLHKYQFIPASAGVDSDTLALLKELYSRGMVVGQAFEDTRKLLKAIGKATEALDVPQSSRQNRPKSELAGSPLVAVATLTPRDHEQHTTLRHSIAQRNSFSAFLNSTFDMDFPFDPMMRDLQEGERWHLVETFTDVTSPFGQRLTMLYVGRGTQTADGTAGNPDSAPATHDSKTHSIQYQQPLVPPSNHISPRGTVYFDCDVQDPLTVRAAHDGSDYSDSTSRRTLVAPEMHTA